VWEEGALEGAYARMHPAGGAAEGWLEAGRSFLASGFTREAREALELAAAEAERYGVAHLAELALGQLPS
jgi:hypothetical protein